MHMCVYIYIYTYIHTYTCEGQARGSDWNRSSWSRATHKNCRGLLALTSPSVCLSLLLSLPLPTPTANLHTKILDFRRFDTIITLIPRGGILISTGNLPEISSQRILVGIILVVQ